MAIRHESTDGVGVALTVTRREALVGHVEEDEVIAFLFVLYIIIYHPFSGGD